MNIDYLGYFAYGDEDAVKQFTTAHYFTHDAEAGAIAKQFGRNITTFNVSGDSAQESWIALMRRELEEPDYRLLDWLEAHNENHQQMLAAITANLGISVDIPVDLSLANFADDAQLYEWMTLHQQVHQFEQVALKLT